MWICSPNFPFKVFSQWILLSLFKTQKIEVVCFFLWWRLMDDFFGKKHCLNEDKLEKGKCSFHAPKDLILNKNNFVSKYPRKIYLIFYPENFIWLLSRRFDNLVVDFEEWSILAIFCEWKKGGRSLKTWAIDIAAGCAAAQS